MLNRDNPKLIKEIDSILEKIEPEVKYENEKFTEEKKLKENRTKGIKALLTKIAGTGGIDVEMLDEEGYKFSITSRYRGGFNREYADKIAERIHKSDLKDSVKTSILPQSKNKVYIEVKINKKD